MAQTTAIEWTEATWKLAKVSVEELLAKCGQPRSRERKVEDVMVRNHNTGLMRRAGETVTETWIYDRGSTAAPMVVTIIDGRIERIERAR